MSARAAGAVIASYSTSFAASSYLLAPRIRRDIRALYAVVRVADEIVDGAAEDAGLGLAEREKVLSSYERAVREAAASAFHTDPVVQAFGEIARRCRFEDEWIRAFFAAMRSDLRPIRHDAESLARYVYGSAEVVGLMCLAIFRGGSAPDAELARGARALGRGFQMINCLRDVGEDTRVLGRHYLPVLDEEAKDSVIAGVRADFALARRCIPMLPAGARYGVAASLALYEELTDRIARTPASRLAMRRVRVSTPGKVMAALRAVLGLRGRRRG